MIRVVLASASPARRRTLVAAGITPIVRASHVDEDAVRDALPPTRRGPGDQVQALAHAKARAIARAIAAPPRAPRNGEPDSRAPLPPGLGARLLVVGCDSMFALGGELLGKPHSPERARQRIREMRGRSGVLWTGHHMILLRRATRGARSAPSAWSVSAQTGAVVQTGVRFGDMSDAEVDAYVDSGEPLEVAGSFTIDGLGGPFIAGVQGDPHSVVGISLPTLRTMAGDLGVFWPDLWDWRHASEAELPEGAGSSRGAIQ